MAFFGPDWWHHHGSKMGVATFDRQKASLKLTSSAAGLNISKVHVDNIGNRWSVEWFIRQSPTEDVEGALLFTDEELGVAFGLRPAKTPPNSRHLISRFAGDRACQGKFFGKGNYLNIPCPGTGYDGDPNVSVEIDDSIRKAVAELLDLE